MDILEGLFELTSEEKETSKMMYSGKTVRCLVAPYHTYFDLANEVPFTKSTFLFPEREMSSAQVRSFISMLMTSGHDDIKIITADQTIICDMVGDLVRVLTEDGDIVHPHAKTFAANIHTIRYELLENEAYQSSTEKKLQSRDIVNKLIADINESSAMTVDEFQAIIKRIDMIGENLIRIKLHEMAREILIK